MRMTEKTIISTGDIRVYIVESENKLSVRKRVYPIYPYGNYYEEIIELENNVLEYRVIRMNWNGTGSESYGYVVLNTTEREEINNIIRRIKSLEDFNKLIDKFIELKRAREEMVQKMWEKLESKLLALVSADEKVRALNLSQEELREKVNAFIEYYLLGG